MDKAFSCHTGGRGSNQDMTKDFSVPILLGTPATYTDSKNACPEVKILAVPSVG